jgi:uncharacterized membrane protein
MSGLLCWTGALVWICIGIIAFWLIFVELTVGFANSISCMRWRIRHSENFKWRKHWHAALWGTVRDAFSEFYGYRNVGNRTHHHSNGHYWRGIGDWN